MTYLMRAILQSIQPHHTAGVVGVVLNARDEVLVVEHVFHPEHPWGLPGGWLERDEAPAHALARELQEETGIRVSIGLPLLVEAGYYLHSHIDIAFLCHATSDVAGLSSELLDYRWVNLSEVPPMLPFHQAAVQVAMARLYKEA
jgi:8-oxo-dGTP pyrophosphatase MutT (NUDIX family)